MSNMNHVDPKILDMIGKELLEGSVARPGVDGQYEITDLRKAGNVAQKSGARFEQQTKNIINFCKNYYKLPIELVRPTTGEFRCFWNQERKSDWNIVSAKKRIKIECKELGDLQSHFDKLSHCILNVENGHYGKDFWLVYNYNRDKKDCHKMNMFVEKCEEVKQRVAKFQINFECILIDDLPKHMKLL